MNLLSNLLSNGDMAPSNGDRAARCLSILLFFMCVSCCFSAVLTYSREELLLLRTGKDNFNLKNYVKMLQTAY